MVISFRFNESRETQREAAANEEGLCEGACWQLCSLLSWDRSLRVRARLGGDSRMGEQPA